jgi:RNA polymerase sigma-70 factor (ECF subfamily)
MELMKKLPYGYRIVLNMYAVDNKKHEEIAKELGVSISTSKTQLFKARKALLQLLKEQEKQL